MHYDAITLGEKDFGLGIDFIKEMEKNFTLPFVSCNIFWHKNQKPFTKQYIVKKRSGIKIGIVGVISTDAFLPEKLIVKPAEEVLPVILTKLTQKEKCNFLILLSHTGTSQSEELIKRFPQFNLVILGHGAPLSLKAEKINSTFRVGLGSKGKYIANLKFSVSKNNINYETDEITPLKENIPDDPYMLLLIERWKQEEQNWNKQHAPK